MSGAISNTSPLFYLHRLGGLNWLPALFTDVWVPNAVIQELDAGERTGCDVPNLSSSSWIRVVDPMRFPSEWLALDLGPGELSALGLALENPHRIVLLDDALARRIAQAAGLKVWGTLRVLLESKNLGLIPNVAPIIGELQSLGMWISDEVRNRILALAGENAEH